MEMLAFVKPVPKKSAPRDDVSKKHVGGSPMGLSLPPSGLSF
jgi:hypothetical protein